jgi:hypothetical protein
MELLPALQQARRELLDPEKEISLRAIADWLNAPERNYRSIKGARFHAPTIQRILYHTGEQLRQLAKFEYERSRHVVMFKFTEKQDRKERLAALAQTFAERTKESEELDRQLGAIQRFG